MKTTICLGIISTGLCVAATHAQTAIESFEYATDDDLAAAWTPSGNATVSLSDSVALHASGTKSLKVDFNFPSTEWATETVRGPVLDTPITIGANQYVTLRLRGDTNFATSDFHNFYLYVYDGDGNFGRWGTPVPATADWQVFNFAASTIEQPWDSSALPDLNNIVQFAIFQYGSQAAIPAYTASIYVDDISTRDKPLTEFPAPSAARSLIDDFEGYASDTALRSFYTYQNSPVATVTTASLDTTAPQGKQALKLAIDFAPGQYPWGSIRSANVPAFSIPTNSVVSYRLKGDPALAAVADNGTSFWLSFYDKGGNHIDYIIPSAAVISPDWTNVVVRTQDLGDISTTDTGNLVQWRILVQGWTGVAEQAGLSASFSVDDIQITVPSAQGPTLTLIRDGTALKVAFEGLTVGSSYDLRVSGDLAQWTTATTITASATSETWTIPTLQTKAFYTLILKPAL